MHKHFYIFVTLLFASTISNAQYLDTYTLRESWSIAQIDSFYTAHDLPSAVLPQSYGVDIYQVTYHTVSYDNVTPTIASGLMVLPRGKDCPSPIISYQHGTVLKRTDAPSNMTGEYIIGIAMGAEGYVALMPDYLGLGASNSIHPYVHARSEATAVRDLIRAAREACDILNMEYNDQVFLTGYSQGGHATMAAHKFLTENHAAEFHIQASVPMSGPYSLSGVMRDLILSNVPYSNPGYLPMVITTYRTVYNIYPDLSVALVAPFDSLVPAWTTGTYSSGWVDNQMNTLGVNPPKQIIIPAVLDTFSNDSTHILRVLLKDNDVYRWVPQVPVYMLYCDADEQVSPLNTHTAFDYMNAAGAPHVTKKSMSPTLDHFNCAQYAILEMRAFFDTMRYDKLTINVTDYQFASGAGGNGSITIQILGGQAPFNIQWSNGQSGYTVSNLDPGTYTATITSGSGCTLTQNFNMSYSAGINNNTKDVKLKEIYPSPATEVLYLNYMDDAYTITDMSGKIIQSGSSQGEKTSIDVSQLTPGSYMFRCGEFRKIFIKSKN